MSIIQKGNNCIVTFDGETKCLIDCDAFKLSNTLYDKYGKKYSEKDMNRFGFKLSGKE